MRNYWLTKVLLDDINEELRDCGIFSGDMNSFVDAYGIVVAHIEASDPSFKLHSDFQRLNLCYKHNRGFFVELGEAEK